MPRGDALVGLVTLDDVRKVPRSDWATTTVDQVMTPRDKLVVATPDEDAGATLSRLADSGVGQLPVLQHGRLVGLLRPRDIVRWLQLHSRERSG